MTRKSGLLLFSGPVSSGKTTTIYRLLQESYDTEPKQIITMESPVEIKDQRFLQVEVNEASDITYDVLIRASLRHHPDILMIGEIRDEETAQMVIRAALTGHLVLATIHAKDCSGVLSRMKELGVTTEQLLQTLLLVTTQRLLPLKNGQLAVLFEVMKAEEIYPYLLHQELPDSFISLNQKLEEASKNGKIDQEIRDAYWVETALNY